jgi:hypothetical protein
VVGAGGGGGAGMGGAIFNHGGTVALTSCSFQGNQALGGVGGAAGLQVGTQGVSGTPGGSGGGGYGGAIFNLNGTVSLVLVTLSGNGVTGGAAGAAWGNGPAGAVGQAAAPASDNMSATAGVFAAAQVPAALVKLDYTPLGPNDLVTNQAQGTATMFAM